MNKETLEKAKELEKDIRAMENSLCYYKRGRWSNWGINDSASTFHFAFHKHYGDGSAYREDLPRWLNGPLMEVIEREMNRCKTELDNLGDDGQQVVKPSEWQPTYQYIEGERVVRDGIEYEFRSGSFVPLDGKGKKHGDKFADRFVRTLDRMTSWLLYSITFCFLIGVVGIDLSTREVFGYSLMLGFFAGSINNIERVLRELFGKTKED